MLQYTIERSRNTGFLAIALVALALTAAPASGQLRIVAWNTYHKPGGPGDSNWQVVLTAMRNEVVEGIAKRPAILALTELGTDRDPDSNPLSGYYILTMCNNLWAGEGGNYSRAQIHAGGYEDYAFIYDTTQVVLVAQQEVAAGYRPALYGRFRPVGYDAGADFHIYNVHLKAYPGYEGTRLGEIASVISNHAISLPNDAAVMYVGDFNFTTTGQEGAYDLIVNGLHQQTAFDPHAAETAPGYYGSGPPAPPAAYCTYSSSNAWSRIDFQFPSHELGDGEGMDLIDGTYRVFGNVGGFPNPIECWWASDHFAVKADYQVPAKMQVTESIVPSAIVVDAVAVKEVTVTNNADVVAANGADELDYDLITMGSFHGATSGTDLALGGGNTHLVTYDTSALGVYHGSFEVTTTSPAVPAGSYSSGQITYYVYAHSEGSFAADANTDILSLDLGAFAPDSGIQTTPFTIHNIGNPPAATATLDILGVAGVGDVNALFTNATPAHITAGDAQQYAASLDTDASQGIMSATWTLSVADDQTLLGAAPGANLVLELTGYIAIDGDLNLDRRVDDLDLGILLSHWNQTGQGWIGGDLDGDGTVDDLDLGIMLGNWGPASK